MPSGFCNRMDPEARMCLQWVGRAVGRIPVPSLELEASVCSFPFVPSHGLRRWGQCTHLASQALRASYNLNTFQGCIGLSQQPAAGYVLKQVVGGHRSARCSQRAHVSGVSESHSGAGVWLHFCSWSCLLDLILTVINTESSSLQKKIRHLIAYLLCLYV